MADFGLARPLVNTIPVEHLGTLLWSAPEILTMEGQSQLSDTWSLACTAVEIFSEQIPYHHLHQYDPREVKKVLNKVENRDLVRNTHGMNSEEEQFIFSFR